MKVDWDVWGAQTVTINRGCQSTVSVFLSALYKVTVQHGIVNDHCVDSGQSFNSLFKDCVKYCTDDACNDIFDEIAEEFTSENNQEECYSCKYIELEDGTVSGNKACFDSPSDINAEHKCPKYANAGCYTGSTAFYVSAP